MEGIERIQAEVLEMNNYNVSAIFEYLKTRDELKECFNNEEKSIKEMYEYIRDKASPLQQEHVAMVDNRVVYLWAVTYFKKSNEELGITNKKVMPPTSKEVIEKIDKKADEKETEKEENQISMFSEVNE